MAKETKHLRKGFTLIELVITAIAAVVLVIGICAILAAGHRNFQTMWARTTSEVVRNSYEARIIFDKIVRKSLIEYPEFPTSSSDITVYYYSDAENMNLGAYPDKWARFYLLNNDADPDTELVVDIGNLNLATPDPWDQTSGLTSRLTLAHNVSAVEFTIKGASIRMSLTLDDTRNPGNTDVLRTLKLDVTTTAIRHNRLPDST